MTDATVAELRALLEKATPGKWAALIDNYGEDTWPGSMFITADPSESQTALCRDLTQDDARLIAAAVNALPDLLARLESADSLDVPILADALHAKVCGPFVTIDPKDCIHGRGRDETLAKAIATEYAALREDVR